MKSYLKYLLACLGLLLLLPACKNESDVEEATIDVSTQLMTFTKDGGEQTLTVKTNKDTWTAFTTQESWLTLTQEGNALKVKASANDRGVDRSASIIVNAGGAQRRVAVTQSAADGLIEMTDTSRTLPPRLVPRRRSPSRAMAVPSRPSWLPQPTGSPSTASLMAASSSLRRKVPRSIVAV